MYQPNPFPVYKLSPRVNGPMLSAGSSVRAPIELAAISVFSVMSTIFQSRLKVRRRNGQESPTSLFFIGIGESGERKSGLDKKMTSGLRQFELEQKRVHASRLEVYKIQFKKWNKQKAALLGDIERLLDAGETTAVVNAELDVHMQLEPVLPKLPISLINDVTIEAVTRRLCDSLSTSVWSDEGGMVLNGHASQGLTTYNKAWDGDAIYVDRVSRESIFIPEPRLSICLMLQPKTFAKFLKRSGVMARDNGFLARCCVTHPQSTQGTRFINGVPDERGIEEFNTRVTEILEESIAKPGEAHPPPVIATFSEEAEQLLDQLANNIEKDLAADGSLADVRDWASKLVNMAARFAALFHAFEGYKGPISPSTTDQAIEVAIWFLNEFRRLFGQQAQLPTEARHAEELEQWIQKLVFQFPMLTELTQNYIVQHGPNAMRKKSLIEAALRVLETNQRLMVCQVGKGKNIVLNPAFFICHHGLTVPPVRKLPYRMVPNMR